MGSDMNVHGSQVGVAWELVRRNKGVYKGIHSVSKIESKNVYEKG